MATKYVFSDEAGCFTFNRNPNVSIYFIVCTITMTDLSVGEALHGLRHKLVWDRAPVRDYFHATEDAKVVRDAVFAELVKHKFKIQATICEKPKAQPQVRRDKARFYKYPFYYQFKHGLAPHVRREDDILITTASIGTRKERTAFYNALDDVMTQTIKAANWIIDFRPAHCDPCLQVADYCAWAIQRKYERADTRSYDMIKDRISYEYELWKHGTELYY